MSNFLEAIEARLSSMLEDTLDRIIYPGLARSLSVQLLQMIDAKLRAQTAPKGLAPDLLTLWVSPDRWDAWQATHEVLDDVMHEIETVFTAQGYRFRTHPQIQIFQDPNLDVDALNLQAGYSRPNLDNTRTTVQKVAGRQTNQILPKGAYLIINGKEHVQLRDSIINLGRRSGNDIVINDPSVSREHLQLRGSQGQYTLFDLSTSGGTRVNNRVCSTAVLKPGDVIRIGQTILIYNQDHEPLAGTELIAPGIQGGQP